MKKRFYVFIAYTLYYIGDFIWWILSHWPVNKIDWLNGWLFKLYSWFMNKSVDLQDDVDADRPWFIIRNEPFTDDLKD